MKAQRKHKVSFDVTQTEMELISLIAKRAFKTKTLRYASVLDANMDVTAAATWRTLSRAVRSKAYFFIRQSIAPWRTCNRR